MRVKTATIMGLKDKDLRCLLLGHAWGDAPILATVLENGLKAWKQELTCGSCGSRRFDTLEPKTFDVWRRHYDWVPGYGCDEPYVRADLRAENARRAGGDVNGQVSRG
jgi:hypothetical protein